MARMNTDDIRLLQPVFSGEFANSLAKSPDPRNHDTLSWFLPNYANVRVTPDTALEVSTVWACVQIISGSLASSDWNVCEITGDNDLHILYDDRVQYLLNTRPNDETTAKSMKTALAMSACFWGNGYAEIVHDMAGRTAELYNIAPDRVTPFRDGDGSLKYRVKNDDGTEVILKHWEMLHIRGPGITGLVGDAVITRAAGSIALAIAADTFAQSYFGNSTQLGLVVEMPGASSMSEEAYQRLKESFEARHKGAPKAFRFGVMEGGAKLHTMNVEADKAQMTESRKNQVVEICRWFGVPPHKVGHMEAATLNNVEQMGIEFARDTLRPWAREIREECEFKLFSSRGRKRTVRVDLDWASQGDYKSRMEGHQIARGMGVFSANDILRAEGKNTIGKEGDVRIVNGASVRLEDVGKEMKADPKKPQPDRGEGSQDPARKDPLDSVYARWICTIVDRAERREVHRREQGQSAESVVADQKSYLTKELEPVVEELCARYHVSAAELTDRCRDAIGLRSCDRVTFFTEELSHVRRAE